MECFRYNTFIIGQADKKKSSIEPFILKAVSNTWKADTELDEPVLVQVEAYETLLAQCGMGEHPDDQAQRRKNGFVEVTNYFTFPNRLHL